MARMARIKLSGEEAFYLVSSHTVWERQKAFSLEEKKKFISLLFKLSKLYFIKILAYTVMDNHFHLVVRMLPQKRFSDEEVIRRVRTFYGDKIKIFSSQQIQYWRKRLEDLSEFVKALKQRFAQWYNKKHDRKGHLWSDRFHSALLQEGRAVLAAMAYVDLNGVRAGLVRKISDYIWCSYHVRLCADGEKWLAPVEECGEITINSLSDYISFVEDKYKNEKENSERIFLKRVIHLVKGVVVGSETFVRVFLEHIREKSYTRSLRRVEELPIKGLFSINLRLKRIS